MYLQFAKYKTSRKGKRVWYG